MKRKVLGAAIALAAFAQAVPASAIHANIIIKPQYLGESASIWQWLLGSLGRP